VPPAVSFSVSTLQNRPDFLKTARARRKAMPAFTLQARRRDDTQAARTDIRIGFTCSRKVGNAVARNRAKRRLRAVAREVLPAHGRPGWDYVLIGRPQTTALHPFDDLRRDLLTALQMVHE